MLAKRKKCVSSNNFIWAWLIYFSKKSGWNPNKHLQTPSTSSHSVFGVILLRSLWILWYLHTYSHNKHKSRSSFSEILSRHPLCILSFYFPPQVVVIVRNSSIYFLLHLTSLVSVCATFFQLYCKTEVDLYFQK